MDKKLKYVKLVFYEDKKNYDNSWGEVYYKLIYGDNQVDRTYKDRITKKEYPLCLKAFRAQEGTNDLPFEKYQIYDARTKKPLNMPYYLKKESTVEKIWDKAKQGLGNLGEKYYTSKDTLKRREIKEQDKSLLNSIRGGIEDIKENISKNYKVGGNNKKMVVRITSLATTIVLLSTLANYEIKKNKIYNSDMIYTTKMSNSNNFLDNYLRDNYSRFEEIMGRLCSHDYKDIERNDIDFVSDYLYKLGGASTDNFSDGIFYEFNYLDYLDHDSADYRFFLSNSSHYGSILRYGSFNNTNAYEYCARGCNLLYYTISGLTMNKSTYMPLKDDIYAFNRMSMLSKIVFLNQLKGVVQAINFSYKEGDKPYWWLGLRMNKDSLVKKIDDLLEICTYNLKYDIDASKTEEKRV